MSFTVTSRKESTKSTDYNKAATGPIVSRQWHTWLKFSWKKRGKHNIKLNRLLEEARNICEVRAHVWQKLAEINFKCRFWYSTRKFPDDFTVHLDSNGHKRNF